MTLVEANASVETPLADLEATIEQGLNSFVEVGNALIQIKIGKRYREAGYPTFEDYCSQRWGISRQQGNRLVAAAATHETLANALPEAGEPVGPTKPEPVGSTLPTSESQARPLTSLRDDQKVEAWQRAVTKADGAQPTAAQVSEAVAEVAPPDLEAEAIAEFPFLNEYSDRSQIVPTAQGIRNTPEGPKREQRIEAAKTWPAAEAAAAEAGPAFDPADETRQAIEAFVAAGSHLVELPARPEDVIAAAPADEIADWRSWLLRTARVATDLADTFGTSNTLRRVK